TLPSTTREYTLNNHQTSEPTFTLITAKSWEERRIKNFISNPPSPIIKPLFLSAFFKHSTTTLHSLSSNLSRPPTNRSNMNSHPTGNSGSLSDTLKGYVNVAMAKGQEAMEQAKVLGHKAHEQLNQAMSQAQEAATHSTQQQANTGSHSASVAGAQHQAQANPQAGAQMGMNNQDAFSDLHQFNTQATADNAAYQAKQAAANAASKASQTTL
ncbi:MAG: hypothetical protein JOS17DRAFT_371003, partial [Linnemannia elongata]